MSDPVLDPEEQDILASYERGELVRPPEADRLMAEARAMARATIAAREARGAERG